MYDINLLPEELRVSRKVPFRTKLPKLMLALAIFALFSSYLFLLLHSRALEKELVDVKSQLEIYEGRAQKVLEEQEAWQNLQKKAEEVEAIWKSRIYWSRFLTEVERALPSDVRLKSLEIGQGNKLRIEGVSYSFDSIGSFYVALKDISLIKDPKVESVQEKSRDESGRSLLEFTITADVGEGTQNER